MFRDGTFCTTMNRPTPLKRAIFESGRRQKDLAAEVGVSEAVLSRFVNGLHAPEATRRKLAKALARPVDELFPPDSNQVAA